MLVFGCLRGELGRTSPSHFSLFLLRLIKQSINKGTMTTQNPKEEQMVYFITEEEVKAMERAVASLRATQIMQGTPDNEVIRALFSINHNVKERGSMEAEVWE